MAFEVGAGSYVVYPADKAEVGGIGTQGAATYAIIKDVKIYCDGSAACIGFVWDGSSFKTFSGMLWEGSVGKVRAVGEFINSWISEPSANR